MHKSVLLAAVVSSTTWLHTETRSIAKEEKSGIYYLAQKIGTLVPVAQSSCVSTGNSDCLINIPSDISVDAPGQYMQRAPMLNAPTNGGNLTLSGNLVPTMNGANHTAYYVQLVFGDSGSCTDISQLSQVVMYPMYGNCSRIGAVGNTTYYIKSTQKVATNGLPYIEDTHCTDPACSASCIPGQTFSLNSTCGNNSGKMSYWLSTLVTPSGLTLTGFDKATPSAPGTVAAPTPTGPTGSAIAASRVEALSLVSLLAAFYAF
ncbi:hypothetical protein HDV03_004861 [Kappamyces sp. JEL0829]|nr:hypothetical protein HDV03_004861 [Kappamyces sp. JEL0829]